MEALCHTTKKEIQPSGEKISSGEERKRKKRKKREGGNEGRVEVLP